MGDGWESLWRQFASPFPTPVVPGGARETVCQDPRSRISDGGWRRRTVIRRRRPRGKMSWISSNGDGGSEGHGDDGNEMTGLEQRLRDVAGVSDIVIELSDDGLEGIRVRMNEGTDESEVLEEIRRILVAYGLKGSTRKKAGTPGAIPELELEDDGVERGNGVVEERAPVPSEAHAHEAVSPVVGLPSPAIIPAGDQLTVRLSDGSRVVEAVADATPLGAADAMIRALCEWRGAPFPSRIAIDRFDVDGTDLVIVVARRNSVAAVGSSVIRGSLAIALRDACSHIVDQLDRL